MLLLLLLPDELFKHHPCHKPMRILAALLQEQLLVGTRGLGRLPIYTGPFRGA